MPAPPDHAAAIDRLLAIMAALRNPDGGCPWDLEQDFSTIAPYTIEEAYEVDDAIRHGDMTALRDELGDLLLQVVFHAQMADEAGHFDFDDVAAGIADKMLQRHPHVFGTEDIATAEAQTLAWEDTKARERAAKAQQRGGKPPGALDGVALGLPALLRAVKLQRRAARVGFDWPDVAPVYDKLQEEIRELRDVVQNENSAPDRLQEEIGDLLFSAVNLARHHGIEPEEALRAANAKFERRFASVEASLAADGLTPADLDIDALEARWQRAKAGQ